MAEATPVVGNTGKDSHKCFICHQKFRDPTVIDLPCKHKFCRECLEVWASDRQGLVCPECRKQVSLPEGVKRLPVCTSSKGDCEKNTNVVCGNCNDHEKKAKFHCFDCNAHLCNSCHTSHVTLKSMKDHKVVTIEDLLSGKATDEGRICKEHDEPVKYYCETERKQVCIDCVSLKTCSVEHERVSLKSASKKQTTAIQELVENSKASKEKIHDAVKITENVHKDFDKFKCTTREELERTKKIYIFTIEQMFKEKEEEIEKVALERTRKLDSKMKELNTRLSEIDKASKEAAMVIQSGSEYEITSSYASLSDNLQKLNKSLPIAADESLSNFECHLPVIHIVGNLELQLLLLGCTGAGKSATGNSILMRDIFKENNDPGRRTRGISTAHGNCLNMNISVTDTPGPYDWELSNDTVLPMIFDQCPPPHSIIIVVSVMSRLNICFLEVLKNVLGENFSKYVILVFTHIDRLRRRRGAPLTPIKDYVESRAYQSSQFKNILDACDNRYVGMNNGLEYESKEHQQQVQTLLTLITLVVSKNEGQTCPLFTGKQVLDSHSPKPKAKNSWW